MSDKILKQLDLADFPNLTLETVLQNQSSKSTAVSNHTLAAREDVHETISPIPKPWFSSLPSDRALWSTVICAIFYRISLHDNLERTYQMFRGRADFGLPTAVYLQKFSV